tara:strand:+ start:77 stop:901 length:825 start_codon:yes stop_codon:yes gene_type:complete
MTYNNNERCEWCGVDMNEPLGNPPWCDVDLCSHDCYESFFNYDDEQVHLSKELLDDIERNFDELNGVRSLEYLCKLKCLDKKFEYYDYYDDWSDFINYDERAKTVVGIGNAFRMWLRIKGFGHWIDESDEDFAGRGIQQKRDGTEDTKEERWDIIVNHPRLSALVYDCMNSFSNKTSKFDGGFVRINNPYMKINGNCVKENSKYFRELYMKGKKNVELWEILSNGHYHIVIHLNGKMLDRSNGCLKMMDMDMYAETCNMEIIKKYDIGSIFEMM